MRRLRLIGTVLAVALLASTALMIDSGDVRARGSKRAKNLTALDRYVASPDPNFSYRLVETIKRVRAHLNPRLEIEGLLRTMYDPRNTLSLQVSQQLTQHFGSKVYRTVIPRNVRLAEAPSYGRPVLEFDRQSKGALAYLALAGEMLNRAAMT